MHPPEAVLVQLDRIRSRSLWVGILALALCLAGSSLSPRQFFQSYLQAYLFWIGISLGCLAVLMLHHLVGGRWGFPVRRLLEAGSRTLPLMALLFVPVLLGLRQLYIWARPQEVAADALLQHKVPYLNVPAFVVRTIIYFAIWIVVAHFLSKWSLEQDRTGDRSLLQRFNLLSGPGLVLYGLTATFSSIDWVMSLEPEWHSSIYGMVFMAGHGLEALAFVIIIAAMLADRRPLSNVISTRSFHDLGNLLLTFLMLWAYMAFAQYLIVWAENLTDEVPWYLSRTGGGWQGIAVALIVAQFALPFVLLLSRATKRSSGALAAVAVLTLLMRMVDLLWLVAPAFHPAALHVHWMDVLAPIGVGGLWIAMFATLLKGRPLVPLHDPRMEAVVEQAGGVSA